MSRGTETARPVFLAEGPAREKARGSGHDAAERVRPDR